MLLQCADRSLDLRRTAVMGIINVTPDSFSDGGSFFAADDAVRQALIMQTAGADIIDIGGESTRPGASPVSLQEEMDRVLPVIERLHSECDSLLSIDTSKPQLMQEATLAGAHIINDINALQEKGAIKSVLDSNAAVCLMHKQGSPATMQLKPHYQDVVSEVQSFLARRIQACETAGIDRDHIVVDPGFGFGKSVAHNLSLLKHLSTLQALHLPVLVGLSRKSMIDDLLDLQLQDREAASIVLALLARQNGANILRVHDVAGTVQAVRLLEAINRE